MFLSAFPIVAIIVLSVAKPDYYDEVRQTSLFIPCALGVGVFLVINMIFMRVMVNIKV
jgi:tight adherence protein B